MSELMHYGVKRRSGRYPWGSGEDPNQHDGSFMGVVDAMRAQGMNDSEIARARGMSRNELQARLKSERLAKYEADRAQLLRLKDKGYSNVAAAERLNISEAKVRMMLKEPEKNKALALDKAAADLKAHVQEKKYLDIGAGTENHMGISKTELDAAVTRLKDEGYEVHRMKVEQLGTGKDTTMKVLVPPGVTYAELHAHAGDIRTVTSIDQPDGTTLLGIRPPVSVDSKRLGIVYGDEGGTMKDGVIELRRGKEDISLGNSSYAQVRIAVDGTHYIKGMAMYRDDMPDGVDILFNTNKSNTGNKLDALKSLKDDPDNPFGAVVKKQRIFKDANGKDQQSAINIVNEEGDWSKWSKSLSSQMLSKQPVQLAKEQLGISRTRREIELDEIRQLTNPVVKKKLLEAYADGADSAAEHLKAAALPRQRSQVILPITDIKPGEVYAPNFRNGEKVVLIRYPHGGRFEIPEVTVNNNHPAAKSILKNAKDAIGIHPSVAERLSGADFDGDTVMVIPNGKGKIKSKSPLKGLEGFDPKARYPQYEGMKIMSNTQRQMGDISNLITDMTIKGADDSELARAVRHSMVVIDAEKHKLNYKQSAIDNGIASLKAKYQGGPRSGASTLVSLSKSDVRVPERKQTFDIDPATGKKTYRETGATYIDAKGNTVKRTSISTRMKETDDANTLSSGTEMERVYSTHANQMKALANQARKELVSTPLAQYDRGARQAYANEVASLEKKLHTATLNKPQERQAQVLANAVVKAKIAEDPSMKRAEIKRLQSQALASARARTGAKKPMLDISDREWEAIQAGAISSTKLGQILDNADMDRVKELATPRARKNLAPSTIARARAMQKNGDTVAEIADALGLSVDTLHEQL